MESILRGQSRVNSSRGSTAIRQWARNYATSSPLPTDQPSLMLPKEIPFIPPCRFSKQQIIDRCIDKSINRPPVKRATRSAMKGTQDEGKKGFDENDHDFSLNRYKHRQIDRNISSTFCHVSRIYDSIWNIEEEKCRVLSYLGRK